MRFQAQIKSVTIKETVSNDKEAKVQIITDSETAVELQKYIGEEVVTLEVKDE
jgi:hypothetical protein